MSGLAFANPGAEEEAPGGLAGAALEHARCAARLWGALLPWGTPGEGLLAGTATGWPEALAPRAEAAAWAWIAPDHAQAWLNTSAAAGAAQARGLPLAGAAPEVVLRVHDKAFAHGVCEAEGLIPPSLRGLVSVWSPDALRAPRAAEAIRARVAAWPAWTGGRFTLKPRIGGSGRGRIGGVVRAAGDRRGGEADAGSRREPAASAAPASAADLAPALPRLASCGGALLEPWLPRERDYSVQLHVAADGTLTLLGTLVLETSDSGVYRGHRARLDHRMRLSCGHHDESALLETALLVAGAAHRAGYVGPCGVDGFRFRGESGSELRACVELNARFTMGTVVAGLTRRLRPRARSRLVSQPGDAFALQFALDTPAEGWPETALPQRLVVPLAAPGERLRPALVIARVDERPAEPR